MRPDVRGPRFAAALTTIVLIVILVTGNGWLALAQATVFALGATHARWAPRLRYRTLVQPRLGPPTQFEPAEPSGSPRASGSRSWPPRRLATFRGHRRRGRGDVVRARGRVPQRRVRALPRLRGLPAPAAYFAPRAGGATAASEIRQP